MINSLIAPSMLKLAGWKFETDKPAYKKYIALSVPHTSNLDGLLLVTLAKTIDLDISWMIKDTWFKGPMGSLLRATGAVAINRDKSTNVVDSMVAEFARREEFPLFIPPEGTRKRAEYWKSGFYHIARKANVPVVCGYIDYATRRAGLGPAYMMTGDVKADMDKIRAFYAKRNPIGYSPKDFGPIRLKEEEAAASAATRT